ncbi:hypothetical protein CSUB01_05959 [Colletotrichum sublineola]|uniref:C6 zinc finger protein n=1 Tax=Colletotrichum sublineola TaxID=1173701 RepID=A0A066WVT8_COLSU|nr:hypothetical protein CSUB01_05959 [Colletotrichum sublineola]
MQQPLGNSEPMGVSSLGPDIVLARRALNVQQQHLQSDKRRLATISEERGPMETSQAIKSYDKPDFSLLELLQQCIRSRCSSNPLDAISKIGLINEGINQTILKAVEYIRSVGPEMRTDSRLIARRTSSPNDLIVSEHQRRICMSLDQWHQELQRFMDCPPDCTRQHPSQCYDSFRCMENEMKCWTAKICVGVCQSRDESAYDWFKDLFKEVVTLARFILESCPETLEPTNSRFDFDKSSYLPLLEFVILKCRWLGIRYDAWLIVRALATRQNKQASYNELCVVGQRIIEEEHRVKINEITPKNAGIVPLPPEELRIRNYTTDARFADLFIAQTIDREELASVQWTYTERILLRCGSWELKTLQSR